MPQSVSFVIWHDGVEDEWKCHVIALNKIFGDRDIHRLCNKLANSLKRRYQKERGY